MKVFIAGHKGLVGSAVIRKAPKEFEIVTIDRSELDLCDSAKITKYFKIEKFDSVILAAAKVGGIAANSRYQSTFLTENLAIQNSVIMAAAKNSVQNLIFLGSSCVYPVAGEQPMRESSLLTGSLEPTNEGYAIAKIAGIRLVRALYEENGSNFKTLMPTNLYGPNDNFDLEFGHVPAALVRKLHEAKIFQSPSVTIWGTGKARREFMHSDDLADACWHFLDKDLKGGIVNVGTGVEVSIAQLAITIANIVGYRGEIKFDSSMPDGAKRKLLDLTKLHEYHWSHSIGLENGLQKTYQWFEKSYLRGEVRGI